MTTMISVTKAALESVAFEIEGTYTHYTLRVDGDGTGRVTALDRGALVELGTLSRDDTAVLCAEFA